MQRLFIVTMLVLGNIFSCQSAHKMKPDLFPHRLIAPEVSLLAVDGTNYKLSDIYGEHKGAVVIFWQSNCPCVKRYQDRITKLFDRYGQDGLAMLYVSSNTNETFVDALFEYEKRQSPLPLLRDEHGHLAHVLNAKGTPTAALFNQKGDLVYMGWIDNERAENENGRSAYLEDAIKEMMADKSVSVPTSPMFGCAIE